MSTTDTTLPHIFLTNHAYHKKKNKKCIYLDSYPIRAWESGENLETKQSLHGTVQLAMHQNTLVQSVRHIQIYLIYIDTETF